MDKRIKIRRVLAGFLAALLVLTGGVGLVMADDTQSAEKEYEAQALQENGLAKEAR